MRQIALGALFTFTAVVCAPCPSFAASGPASEKDVPVFTGAKRIAKPSPAEDADWTRIGAPMSASGSVTPKSHYRQAFAVNSHPETVLAFYQSALRPTASWMQSPQELAPGEAAPVSMEVVAKEMGDEDFETPDATSVHVSATRKKELFRSRPAIKKGEWVHEARFDWSRKEKSGDITLFAVVIEDQGVQEYWRSYSPKTVICIERATYPGEDSSDDLTMPAKKSNKRIPTESDLGVPPYPGARFDKATSEGMTQTDTDYYVFLSNDSVAAIAAFYSQKSGKKPESMSDGSKLLVLKGKSPFPKHGVMIQPNTMLADKAKTIITVVREH